ncbi:MAG TPA: FlgD immunoglobulin-like domain containing protein, partial [Bacteroidota bacterium]
CASDDSGRFAGRYYAHPIRLCAIVSANGWTTGFGYLDLTLTPGQTVDTVVKVKRTTSIGPEQADQGFALFQNYPNPFNPSTTISYTLPAACNVTMTVYDGLGREVIELVRGYRPPGAYRATWNGRDQFGDLVGSGIYLARLVAAERGKGLTVSKTLKLLLLH